MKIKFLRAVGTKDMLSRTRNPDSPEFAGRPDGTPFQEGETADVKDKDAEKFIRCALAEPVRGGEAR